MIFAVGLAVGLFVGTVAGMFVLALCVAAKNGDKWPRG